MLKLLSLIFALVVAIPAAAQLKDPASPSAMELEISKAITELQAENFKLETVMPTASLLFLKDWPVEVQRGLYASLWEETAPLLVDPDQLAVWSWSDPSGEYSVTGYIRRSVVIEVAGEKAYVAVYSVTGGEWNRPTQYMRSLILNAQGEHIHDLRVE